MRSILLLVLACILILAGCSTQSDTEQELLAETSEHVQITFFEPDGIIDCPGNLINDPYPGRCGAYVDENSDDLCDHSQ